MELGCDEGQWIDEFLCLLQNYGLPKDNHVKNPSFRVLLHPFQAGLQHVVNLYTYSERIRILAPCSSWFLYLNFWTLVLWTDGLSLHWLSCSCVLCCRQQIRCNEETQYELSCGISFHNCEASGNGRRCDTDRHQPDNCNSSKGFTSQPSQHWSCKAQHQ